VLKDTDTASIINGTVEGGANNFKWPATSFASKWRQKLI
jgi:hypothetical protein